MANLTVPNAASTLATGIGADGAPVAVVVAPAWFESFAAWVRAIPPTNTVMAYAGAAAPSGWVKDVTVGLPSLPAGYIWIKKL